MPSYESAINSGAGWSARDTKYPKTMYDQHGREWFADIEKKSGFPSGLIRLRHLTPKRHRVPYVPDQGALVMDPNRGDSLFIDYDKLIRDRLEEAEDRYQLAIETATARGWDPPKPGEALDDRLLRLIGKPGPGVELVAAAMQGNPWVLGFTDIPDPRLVQFVVDRQVRRKQQLANLPDFGAASYNAAIGTSDEADDEAAMLASQLEAMGGSDPKLDARLDIEEQFDPKAIGGKTIPTPANKRQELKARGRTMPASSEVP